VDRDLRQARAPEVRHGPGAPHDAPARGGAQGAGGMSVPVCDQVLIGGEWVRAGGGTYPVIDPATEEPAGHAPECSVEQARAAALAAVPADEPLPPRGNAHGLVAREPIGVVACITPFNFPMTNCAGKMGAALACGNTVVVKPAPADPLGVAALCRIVAAVLPPGVLNFVGGQGPEIGEALVLAAEVDMISFTGSSAVGARIQEAVAPRMKRV